MRIRTAIGAGTLGVVVGLIALAGPAFAHHPTYAPSCTGFTASGTDYPAGSHVTIKTDNVTRMNKDFDGEGFTFSRDWDQTLDHPWSIHVFSPDGIGNVDASGTQIHCVTPPTTTPTTQPPATTVPPPASTVPPPATTTPPPATTIPPVDTSVAPPTTVPAVVDSTPPITPAPTSPPTTACTPAGAPIQPGAVLCTQLPPTGSGDAIPLVAVGGTLAVIGVLLVLARRIPRSA